MEYFRYETLDWHEVCLQIAVIAVAPAVIASALVIMSLLLIFGGDLLTMSIKLGA